jgi:hypothetical protein
MEFLPASRTSFIIVSNSKVIAAYDTLAEAEKNITNDYHNLDTVVVYIYELVEKFSRKIVYDKVPGHGKGVGEAT